MAGAVNWASLLSSQLAEVQELSLKRVIKAARKAGSSGSKAELRASLWAFLESSGPKRGLCLEGDKVVRTPLAASTAQAAEQGAAPGPPRKKSRKGSEAETAEALAPQRQQEQHPAPQQEDGKKKKKKMKDIAVKEAAQQQQEQQRVTSAPAAPSQQQPQQQQQRAGDQEVSKKKKPGKKRKAPETQEEGATQPQQQQVEQQPQQQQQQQAGDHEVSKKNKHGKKRKVPETQEEGATQPQQQQDGADADADVDADAATGAAQMRQGRSSAAAGDTQGWRDSSKRMDVKSGPFSKEEKETLRATVAAYASRHGLPTDDYSWVFASSKAGLQRGAWQEIAAALPQRTVKSVWSAATRMFHEGNYQVREQGGRTRLVRAAACCLGKGEGATCWLRR